MGKDNAEAVTKPVAQTPERVEEGPRDTATDQPAGLDRASAASVGKISKTERDPVANDKTLSAAGFRSADDILAPSAVSAPVDKFPVVANADGSMSLIRPDNAIVKSGKPNSYGDVPSVQFSQYDSNGEANRFESYSVIKGDLIQSRYERSADGQWSSVDYKGNRTPAQATDTGKGTVTLRPEGAKTAAEQITAYTDKLFEQARRDASPDPAADAARNAGLERSLYMSGMYQSLRDSMTLEHQDGSKYEPNPNGGGVEISGDGKVLQTKSISDVYSKYGYSADKSLSSVDTFEVSKSGTGVQHTQYLKESDGSWVSVKADGSKTASARSFAIESDGTLKVTAEGTTTAVGLDNRTKLSALPQEVLPLKSAALTEKAAADRSDQGPDKVFEPSEGFKSSQVANAEATDSAALMAKLATTKPWEQASPAERVQAVASIEKAGLNAEQGEEVWRKVGERATKGVALLSLVTGVLTAMTDAEAETLKKQTPGPTTYGH